MLWQPVFFSFSFLFLMSRLSPVSFLYSFALALVFDAKVAWRDYLQYRGTSPECASWHCFEATHLGSKRSIADYRGAAFFYLSRSFSVPVPVPTSFDCARAVKLKKLKVKPLIAPPGSLPCSRYWLVSFFQCSPRVRQSSRTWKRYPRSGFKRACTSTR